MKKAAYIVCMALGCVLFAGSSVFAAKVKVEYGDEEMRRHIAVLNVEIEKNKKEAERLEREIKTIINNMPADEKFKKEEKKIMEEFQKSLRDLEQ